MFYQATANSAALAGAAGAADAAEAVDAVDGAVVASASWPWRSISFTEELTWELWEPPGHLVGKKSSKMTPMVDLWSQKKCLFLEPQLYISLPPIFFGMSKIQPQSHWTASPFPPLGTTKWPGMTVDVSAGRMRASTFNVFRKHDESDGINSWSRFKEPPLELWMHQVNLAPRKAPKHSPV